jgi:hypothetical protein
MQVGGPVAVDGDTSFLDGVAGPGWLVEQIGDLYHAGEIADSSGRTTAVPAINAITGLTHVAWFSKRQILHAWYGPEVAVISGYVHAGNQGSAGGLGDLIVSPLNLQWKEWKVGRFRMQQRVVFDFFLPTGEYQRSSVVNLSSHAFAANPYYAVTVFRGEALGDKLRVCTREPGRRSAEPPMPLG